MEINCTSRYGHCPAQIQVARVDQNVHVPRAESGQQGSFTSLPSSGGG